jgi:hypothetical protein
MTQIIDTPSPSQTCRLNNIVYEFCFSFLLQDYYPIKWCQPAIETV